jgi:2-deoxy-scyllo-inosamine dehydrogenase (SAM-dependent)/8-amino-3,8-dideoxy-alpha-D-manno-octulosonate transaminase
VSTSSETIEQPEDRSAADATPLFERLQIESQSNCNRACWFCPRTYDRTGKYLDATGKPVLRQMPTEKIIGLLDEARALGFRGRVGFYHYSEPLLDPRNTLLAQEARRRDMIPYLHTNGDVLRRDDALCEIVRRVYAFIVVGLYDYRTDDELEAAKQFWRARLAGANLEFSPIGLSDGRSSHSIGVARALVPPDRRMTLPDLTFQNAPCHRPLIRMLVQYDGAVCLCCEDTSGAFDLGNVYDRSLADIWFSDRHTSIIRDLKAGRRDRYDLCRTCPMPPTGPPPPGVRLSFARRRYHPPVAADLPATPAEDPRRAITPGIESRSG